uniref:Uncharacterized protein n=1 Tax=Oryza brachyantha TaxID=4533 RepID=J3M763_ORYBR
MKIFAKNRLAVREACVRKMRRSILPSNQTAPEYHKNIKDDTTLKIFEQIALALSTSAAATETFHPSHQREHDSEAKHMHAQRGDAAVFQQPLKGGE